MIDFSTLTDSLTIQTSGEPSVHCVFVKSGDRWSHHWLLLSEGESHLIMSSVEGAPGQTWPPSSPLQEVSHQAVVEGKAILGVGMAGTSHWSASFSIESADNRIELIKADMACLQKTTDSIPVSTYQLNDGCSIADSSSHQIDLRVGPGHRVRIRTLADTELPTTFVVEGQQLEIKPVEVSEIPTSATRWGFSVDTGR